MLNFWSLELRISTVLARCSGMKSESVFGAAIYKGAMLVLSHLNAEILIALLTIDTKNMALIHEGRMSHSSYAADAALR